MVVGSLASCTAAVAAVVSRSGAVLPSQVKVSAVVAVRRSCATGEDGCCGGRRDVKVRGDGGYCFRRVAVVAGEEMAAAAAMVGGREIRVRVSCVRWMR
ncbi:hypothetical protein DEO72_LG2g3383 [Vigna unguiculata]|uniref:Uncharacterized protein n=1 Tax=Vigna unguiculata TaxID=3917 RepID=A0A4D6L3J1_VIGUN|nr:hypothetical protein DEO72_LG2g3383 [Vigna unguiculata]